MKFSIVVPVAPERNAEVIESIKSIDYPKKDFNVVVVKGRNPSDNRNKGVEKSDGEIIVFLDDDAKVDKNILKEAEKFFDLYNIDIVGGPQLTPVEDRGIAKISGYALSSIFGAWKMANRYSGRKPVLDADEIMLTSANLFCRRKVFEKVKFNPLLFPGEDPDFISNAKKQGFKIAYNPGMIIYHKRRDSIAKLARQVYNYGITRPKKEGIKETLKMPFFIVPSLFLIYLVFLFLFALSNSIFTGNAIGVNSNLSFVILIPFLLYIVLNFFFSAANAVINRDFLALFVLPYIYFVIHMSYGSGFLLSTIGRVFSKREFKNI